MDREPTKVEVLEQLKRILKSEEFQSSPRKQKFLRYIVEKTLDGEGAGLKGYSIGFDVFDRGDSFDPQHDTIVRVQAGNLRKSLSLYYLKEGRSDPVLIEIPKGKYVPNFEMLAAKISNDEGASDVIGRDSQGLPVDIVATTGIFRSIRAWIQKNFIFSAVMIVAFLSVAALLIAPSLYNLDHQKDGFDQAVVMPMGPSISIAPFEIIQGESAKTGNRDMEILRAGLHMELIDKLSRFKDLFVMEVNGDTDPNLAPDNTRNLQFELAGTIQMVGEEIRITSILKRQSNGQILWTRSDSEILDKPSAIFNIQREIAIDVAASLGQPYSSINARFGAVHSNLKGMHLDHYLCMMGYYHYFLAKSESEHKRIRNCLEIATTAMPNYSSAWAALSWMYSDEEFNNFNLRTDSAPPFERALQAGLRAVEADSENAMAYQYLSLAKFSLGDDAGFRETAEKALRFNPNDTEILADIGSILIQIDNSDQGRKMVEKAIAMNPARPPWYHGSIGMYYYTRGNSDAALYHARIYLRDGALLAHIMNTATLIQNGQIAEGRKAYQNLVKNYPYFPDSYRNSIKVRRIPEGMYDQLIGDLVIAGLVPVANDQ